MKFNLSTTEGRRKFNRVSILGVIVIYFSYAVYLTFLTSNEGAGFLLIALMVMAPLQVLFLSLFSYFFERGYFAALFLLGWVVADTVLLIIGSELMPSLKLLELVL